MRRLTPGDITRKLARIEHSERSRRWRKRARAQLLKDVGAVPVPGTANLDVPTGRVCVKRRYPTFTTAFQALIDTWNRPNRVKRREKRVHPCPYCNGWHLTSQDYDEERHNGHTEETTDRGHPGEREAGQGQGHRDSEARD